MEALVLSLVAPITATFTGVNKLKGILIFLAVMTTLTYVFLFYRCKLRTKANDQGKKPSIKFKSALFASLIWVLYIGILFVAKIVSSRSPNPITGLYVWLAGSFIVFFLVSWIVYYNYMRVTHEDCFEESLLTKILKWFGNVFKRFLCIFNPVKCATDIVDDVGDLF
jgi:hypothetical protein